jgi:hypothetical protein
MRASMVEKTNIMQAFSVQAPQHPKKPMIRITTPRMMNKRLELR